MRPAPKLDLSAEVDHLKGLIDAAVTGMVERGRTEAEVARSVRWLNDHLGEWMTLAERINVSYVSGLDRLRQSILEDAKRLGGVL